MCPIFSEEYSPNLLASGYDDIEKYCTAMRVEFIIGAKSFSERNEYTAQLEKSGVPKMLEIYRAAKDRYTAATE